MYKIKKFTYELDCLGGWEIRAWSARIDIPSDRCDGGYRAKRIKDGGIANVSRVEYVITSCEGCQSLGAKKSVGIGDDANDHPVFLMRHDCYIPTDNLVLGSK